MCDVTRLSLNTAILILVLCSAAQHCRYRPILSSASKLWTRLKCTSLYTEIQRKLIEYYLSLYHRFKVYEPLDISWIDKVGFCDWYQHFNIGCERLEIEILCSQRCTFNGDMCCITQANIVENVKIVCFKFSNSCFQTAVLD